MIRIPLVYPYATVYAIVDDDDEGYVSQFTWYGLAKETTYYACRRGSIHGNKPNTSIFLHRELMNVLETPNIEVDHIDNNGLNCVRSNMRLATRSQNARNNNVRRGKTGYIGVRKRNSLYIAYAHVDGKYTYVGTFSTDVEAAQARDQYVIERYGEFNRLNFPLLER